MREEITHYDLCKITAERFSKDSEITLFEYQSYATSEFPDVLCFCGGYSTLFEIKINYNDFKKDFEKDCRIKYRIKYGIHPEWTDSKYKKLKRYTWKSYGMEEFIREAPHLGRQRYYVCPSGLVQAEEIDEKWGLYWYKNNRFYKKKESSIFRNDMYAEMRLLEHAFRKYASGLNHNILIKKYG